MRRSAGRIAFLTALYLVQGLPFGFQANALAALLRDQGVSMTHITLTTALALPWSLKALWAPLVDRHHHPALGRRRSWIVPMQLALALSMIAAAFAPIHPDPLPLLALVLAMNLFAATMDIAVDGLAVDLLSQGELGAGNAAQVVGYKIGMLAGGGLLVWASEALHLGWRGLFFTMAGVVALVLVVTLFVDERRLHEHETHGASPSPHVSIREVLATLREAMSRPGAGWLVLVLVTYKLGESLIDPVFNALLVDQGVSRATIGLWVGTYGMAASILGSLGGGVLATRLSVERAFVTVAAARVLALSMPWAIASFGPMPSGFVIASTCAEHLVSGALTTIMFAFMMRHTDRRIGATHYTLLATLEVLGKAPLAMSSGWIADHVGAPISFGAAVALALSWVALFARVRGRLQPASGDVR
ncbi:MAG: MFS transporter [Sandaracinaceae bacterium]|nr:MFS transporter [Sandaracinaceae bacterium]